MAVLLTLSVLLATSAAIVSAGCPGSFIESPYGGNCYEVHRSKKYYCKDARNICQNDGAWLVSIRDGDSMKWINGLYKEYKRSPCNQYYWIGANDLNKEGHFVWQEDGNEIKYHFWEGGEPNNKDNEDCVRVNSDNFEWNDEDYDRSREYCFVCEKYPTFLSEDSE
ncbi:perlucin-like protein [Patiria miniata]|uniref:C-type lectin domain-containing protein n=1 Tax=Patiria miniata TaxID=46514 RepID=A0A913ZV84_PATMI|nr:perlucin-like protein [Patiria miniata]